MKLYTALLTVLVMILSALLLSRKEVDATIMRSAGMLYQERGTDSVSNLYTIKVANKTIRRVPLQLRLEGIPGTVQVVGGDVVAIRQEDEGNGNFFVVLPRQVIQMRKMPINIGLYEGGKKIDEIRTNFLGPMADVN
jgi:hypothetical protein